MWSGRSPVRTRIQLDDLLPFRSPVVDDGARERFELAGTLERVAKRHGFKLRFPAPAPDEVFAEFVTAVLGCAIAAPS